MQTTVERVMQAYGLMVNLTAEQEIKVRERLVCFLRETAREAIRSLLSKACGSCAVSETRELAV